MTKVKLHAPVAEMHGEFEKNSGIIMRQKKYRAPNGAVLKVGVQESYKMAHPRDFDRTPAQGAELANMRSFGEVSRRTTEIIRSERYTAEELAAMTPEERAYNRTPTPIGELSNPFLCPVQETRPGSAFREKTATRFLCTPSQAVFQTRHLHPSPPSPTNSNKQLKIPQILV